MREEKKKIGVWAAVTLLWIVGVVAVISINKNLTKIDHEHELLNERLLMIESILSDR